MMSALLLAVWLGAFPAEDTTAIVPDASVLRLDEVGLYDLGFAYRDQSERLFPRGWAGDFDEATGVACKPSGEQGGRTAFLLHPPWRGGTGIAFQRFVFQLPAAKRIVLRGATAMGTDAAKPGKSDGVTFRVRVGDRTLIDIHRADAAWQPFEFDLTPLAGQTVALRFETDPGPRSNSSFDFALWGDRELILEGYEPPARSHPEPPPLILKALSAPVTGVVPPVATPGLPVFRRDGETLELKVEGPNGTFAYRWERPRVAADPVLGRLSLQAELKGGPAVNVPLASSAAIEWAGPAQPGEARWADGSETAFTRPYTVDGRTANLTVRARVQGQSLVFEVACDAPIVKAFDAGGWGPALRRREVPVPFYSGQVFYLPAEDLFVNALLDWTASNASQHLGTRAVYDSLTDGSRLPMAERAVFSAAWHLAEVLPGIPNPPSPFMKAVGGRLVLDIWGGPYDEITRGLERLADHGISGGLVIVHNWQRDGYDNGLPAHYPAASDKGGEEAMRRLIATGKRLGYGMALHENYVDYYPNYEHFNERDVALDAKGEKQKAWFNEGTKIQSFAVAPDAILRLARGQSSEIHRRYGTSACFVDVHSAVPPWFHVDRRAGAEGAGQFGYVFETHGKLWAFERATHGGPVFGEGNNHWYWSGLLDGAEAQYGSGWPGNQGRSAPLAVEFDLLRIHPLQVNHGMGYHSRWWSDAESDSWGGQAPMVVLDQYRLQTLAYGHAPFLNYGWNQVPLAWLEHNLSVPVATRYALARPEAIKYEVGGRWVDGTAAAKAGAWERVAVKYDNGLNLIANQSDDTMLLDGHALPKYGWLARAPGFVAGTTMRDGIVTDFLDSGDAVFANARAAADWDLSGVVQIRPTVSAFEATGPRQIRFAYDWKVDDTLDRDYTAFVHFGRLGAGIKKGDILFQQDHRTPEPTSAWRPGQVVKDGPHALNLPSDLPDGDYAWTIGLFSPRGGRARLAGPQDGDGRSLLGTLQVRDGGKSLAFEPASDSGNDSQRLYLEHLNAASKVVAFGPIATDGSVAIGREGDDWVLRPWPQDRAFTVRLDVKRFPPPASVASEGGAEPTVKPETVEGMWNMPLNGAKAYRWPAGR